MSLFKRIKDKLQGKTKNQAELELRIKKGMKVGENCHIYSAESIDGAWPWLISFGDNVTVSSNVTILAHDASLNVVSCGTKLGRVEIGNNVFIGANSIVLCDTRINDNVVVAAGSIVTSDLEANAVYAGAPARRMCSIDAFRDKYSALRESRPYFGEERSWDKWYDATDEEKQRMIRELSDGIGFI